MRIDSKTNEALVRLFKSPDGSVLARLLETELQETLGSLASATTDNVPKLQGKAQFLQELTRLLK